jgi:hypothetical protein
MKRVGVRVMTYNKAIESAPGGRPTHKVQCTLFAAHR